MSTCPHCGSGMFLQGLFGQFFWVCPRRNDGHHPVVRIVTTNTTAG